MKRPVQYPGFLGKRFPSKTMPIAVFTSFCRGSKTGLDRINFQKNWHDGRFNILSRLLAICLLCLGLLAATAQTGTADRVRQFNLDKNRLAISGYDPVAYFTGHKAMAGSKENRVEYKNVVYQFASAHNKELFRADPQKYEPQYGGWCAYAMGATGEKVEVDPETFKVLNGRLYLFYNRFFNNTLKSWNKDEINLKNKADRNWLKFIQ